jgi:diketogulonate reductase-like aldo/keto reductase/L-rhamnose mutarotase
MPRHTFITTLREGKAAGYRDYHDNIYPEVAAGLRTAGVKQLNIYQQPGTNVLVMTIDTCGSIDLSAATGPGSRYRQNPRCREWEELMDGEFHNGWTEMKEIHSSDLHWNRALGLPVSTTSVTSSLPRTGATSENSVALSSGHQMPLIGLGTWKSEPGKVAEAVRVAIEAGIRHIDAAAVYGNEKEVGEGIRTGLSSLDGSASRASLFVTSKLWNTEHAPKDVEPACRKTLHDLGLDYLDLYLVHWPISFAKRADGSMFPKDPNTGRIAYAYTPHADTWRAMEGLVEKGLVRSIGVSNFNARQVRALVESASTRIPPAVNQIESHPLLPQRELISLCHKGLKHRVQVTAYSPLGSGSAAILQHPTVLDIAAAHGKNAGQILIRFQVRRRARAASHFPSLFSFFSASRTRYLPSKLL